MFTVWWKRQDEWKQVYETHSFQDALSYAEESITHGHTTQRIEIRDPKETLRTVYDSSWT